MTTLKTSNWNPDNPLLGKLYEEKQGAIKQMEEHTATLDHCIKACMSAE